jgi:formyltetrahydrofolate synthetase
MKRAWKIAQEAEPGLGRTPAALKVDIDAEGRAVGLS